MSKTTHSVLRVQARGRSRPGHTRSLETTNLRPVVARVGVRELCLSQAARSILSFAVYRKGWQQAVLEQQRAQREQQRRLQEMEANVSGNPFEW